MRNKKYSEACERNKEPILDVLSKYFSKHSQQHILEIGSGTGQHAVFFAKKLPHIHWHTSDQTIYHESIKSWIDEDKLANLYHPLNLDINHPCDLDFQVDGIFTSNTCHIMSWNEVKKMFEFVVNILANNGYFIIYGPFKYNGQHTSLSNEAFDNILRSEALKQGIRDVEKLNKLNKSLILIDDIAMPANNRILVFKKQ